MAESTIALLIMAVVIVVFVVNRLPVGVVAIGAAVSLWATGLLELEDALRGFGDPVVVFIGTLFIVSEAIDATGLTTWIGNRVTNIAGSSFSNVMVSMMLLCAGLTALISLNGSVAALLPMAVMIAVRMNRAPSELLMPMVYAGSAGSMLVLMGSPVNVVVSDASRDAGEGAFGFFSFGLIGLPLVIGTVVLGLILSPKLLPHHNPDVVPIDLSQHAERLAQQYQLRDGLYCLSLRSGSRLVGVAAQELTPRDLAGAQVVATQRHDRQPMTDGDELQVDDVLVVTGEPDAIKNAVLDYGLAVEMERTEFDEPRRLVSGDAGIAEVVVPPRSPFIGETVFPGMLRQGDLVILAVRRYGKNTGERPVQVAAGDSLLVYGPWAVLDSLNDDRDVLAVDRPDLVRRQNAPLGRNAAIAAFCLVAMVIALATSVVPPVIAGLVAVMVLVLTGVLSSAQAYRAVSWETLVLVGGLIPLSVAVQTSGAAEQISDVIIGVVGAGSPTLLLAALFVVTCILGLVISNTATVLIVLPIGLAAAAETGVSVRPLLMTIAVAGSAALLTPIQTPGNMMIMSPGGYKFGDYCKFGLPILLFWLAASVVIIPLVWPF